MTATSTFSTRARRSDESRHLRAVQDPFLHWAHGQYEEARAVPLWERWPRVPFSARCQRWLNRLRRILPGGRVRGIEGCVCNIRLEIEGDAINGYHLVKSPEGFFTADNWYQTFDEALASALAVFGVAARDWKESTAQDSPNTSLERTREGYRS